LVRSYYSGTYHEFMNTDDKTIVGTMVENDPGYVRLQTQEGAWFEQIKILKEQFKDCNIDRFLFEYTIPRMGKRVDNILFYQGVVYVIEFKVGSDRYNSADINQVEQYAIDLKNFQEGSAERIIIPILVATDAPDESNKVELDEEQIAKPLFANAQNLCKVLLEIAKEFNEKPINPIDWENSLYKPTPSTIDAATALYEGHTVEEITREDEHDRTFHETVRTVDEIITHSKTNSKKSIIFVTGIPGSGKTLIGLNIAANNQNYDQGEHGIYLCGTQPLVKVIQEALAINSVNNSPFKIKKNGKLSKQRQLSKTKARSRAQTFFQFLPEFRKEAINAISPPNEKIAIFDEAQRMWSAEKVDKELVKKKILPKPVGKSESDHLIGYMDKHADWTIIICLIGGGQEIHKGEDGAIEWFKSIRNNFSHWDVYLPSIMNTQEYTIDTTINECLENIHYTIEDKLHLTTSSRTWKSSVVSLFINALLARDTDKSKQLCSEIKKDGYPILLSRDLEQSKKWLESKTKGTQRRGIFVSSSAQRLRPEGITPLTPMNFEVIEWWLDGKEVVNSSQHLEIPATEFACQGLEVDWAIVGWDLSLRPNGKDWLYQIFQKKGWNDRRTEEAERYLVNSFRVVLTRARQGMVIFIPKGSVTDSTRNPKHYDVIYNYLKEIGLEDL
jgi:hypothetical protein